MASSDTSASNEFLQGSTGLTSSTNPTRIIHLHHSFSHHHKILNSPTHSPPPPVQNFKRTSQVMLDLDDLPPLPQTPPSSVSGSALNNSTPLHDFTSKVGNSVDVDDDSAKVIIEPKTGQSWLLRLFESKMFDASMAVHYLFNSKEPGVLSYLGNRLFTLNDKKVEFFLPQLINMYVQHHEVAEVIHPYLVHRCRQSVDFSLQCAWLLEAYSPANSDSLAKRHRSHSTKLKNLILSGELVPKESSNETSTTATSNLTKKISTTSSKQPNLLSSHSHHQPKRTHMRSRSDASALISSGMCFFPKKNQFHEITAQKIMEIICPKLSFCFTSFLFVSGPPTSIKYPQSIHIRNLSNAGLPGLQVPTVIPLKRLALGDLTSGRAFDNGCACFESCKAAVNDLKGRKTYCKQLFSIIFFARYFCYIFLRRGDLVLSI